MLTLREVVQTFIFAEGVIAMILNTFIVVINSRRVKTGLKKSQCELIQLVMGLVNITMSCSIVAQTLVSIFWPSYTDIRELCSTLVFLHIFHMCFSFWLTAYLCAYYCTTITNSNHWLLVWIKKTLSSQMPLQLLLCGFGSIILTFPLVFSFQIQPQQESVGNITSIVLVVSYNTASKAIMSTFGCFLPFFCVLLSLITTVSSLVRHVQRIKHTESGFAHPNLHAHTHAIRTMLLFLTASVVVYIFESILFIGDPNNKPTTYIALLFVIIFPAVEAVVIIQANAQLRTIILSRLCRARAQ